MIGKISILSAAALIAGGLSYAAAQSPSAQPGAGNSSGKCYDQASGQIKTMSPSGSAAKSGSAASTSGSASSSSSGSMAAKKDNSTSGVNPNRPPQAEGLPNC